MVSASKGGGGVEVISESKEFCMFQLLSRSSDLIQQLDVVDHYSELYKFYSPFGIVIGFFSS